MKEVIRHLGLLCLSGAVLAGCADPAGPADPELASIQPAHSQAVQLRFVHGSPTSPAFDVYLGQSATPLFTAVEFGTATPYATVDPAGIQLVLRSAGAAPTAAPVFTSDVIAAQAGDTVTSFAGGVLGSTLATIKFRIQPYTEAFAAAERGQASVRFVHDSHGVAIAGFDIAADGVIEAPAVAPFTASDAAGIAVPRHRMQLAIDTGSPAARLTSFTVPHDVLAQRGGIFLALVGLPTFVPHDARGLALLAVGRDTTALIRQDPTVYVLPLIPDAAAVDVFAIGARIGIVQAAKGVGFGALAAKLQVSPSDHGYELAVTLASDQTGELTGAPLTFASTGPLAAGERYLAIASGFAARSHAGVQVTVEQDGFDRTVTAAGRMRAVAASPDAPAVDVGQFPPGDGTPFVGLTGMANLGYLAASDPAGVEVAAGAPLNPGVQVTGTTQSLRFLSGAPTATDRVFGVVAGAFAPATGEVGSRFIVVKTPPSGAWTATALSPQP
jgi:hypothetical protein